MISWETAFHPGDQVWLMLACIITILLGPAGVFVLFCRQLSRDQMQNLIKLMPILFSGMLLSWMLWGYSLAYAPSWHSLPDAPPIAAAPTTTLQEAMAIAEARIDETQLIGRGGFVGGTEYVAMKMVAPIMGEDGPLFPRRRPHEHVPHILECLFRLCGLSLFLTALTICWFPQFRPGSIMILSVLWITLVYAPVAHWLSGDGWLDSMGAMDFGGGIFFAAAGAALLACKQPRQLQIKSANQDWQDVLGAAAFWLGLAVYTSAHTFQADLRISLVFINLLLGTASSATIWGIANSFVWNVQIAKQIPAGILVGCIALVPGGPWIQPQSSIIIGAFTGLAVNVFVRLWENVKQSSPPIFPLTFLLGGTIGMLATGIFAAKSIAGTRWDGREITGLIDGNVELLGHQILAVIATIGWSFVLSWLIQRGMKLCLVRFGEHE